MLNHEKKSNAGSKPYDVVMMFKMHCNSTILSHWFYLLSQGGSGTNEGITYNVTGVGINKAEKITYKTLLDLYPTANYNSARNASIQATINLYGSCSREVMSVTNAWHAVGVGSAFTPTTVNFVNQIVTTDTTIVSCGNINVQYVKVQNGAKLTLDAAGEVNIISDFEVELGSEFEIVYP